MYYSDRDPEMDFDGFFHTSSPVIIYQMVDENLQVSATISPDLVYKVGTALCAVMQCCWAGAAAGHRAGDPVRLPLLVRNTGVQGEVRCSPLWTLLY